jgi:hypothetical protein
MAPRLATRDRFFRVQMSPRGVMGALSGDPRERREAMAAPQVGRFGALSRHDVARCTPRNAIYSIIWRFVTQMRPVQAS